MVIAKLQFTVDGLPKVSRECCERAEVEYGLAFHDGLGGISSRVRLRLNAYTEINPDLTKHMYSKIKAFSFVKPEFDSFRVPLQALVLIGLPELLADIEFKGMDMASTYRLSRVRRDVINEFEHESAIHVAEHTANDFYDSIYGSIQRENPEVMNFCQFFIQHQISQPAGAVAAAKILYVSAYEMLRRATQQTLAQGNGSD